MLYWKATATAGNQTPPTTCGLGIVSEDWEYLLRIAPPSTRYVLWYFLLYFFKTLFDGGRMGILSIQNLTKCRVKWHEIL